MNMPKSIWAIRNKLGKTFSFDGPPTPAYTEYVHINLTYKEDSTKSFRKDSDKMCRNLFDAKYPATCRMPSGKEWAFENSHSLQLCRESMYWVYEWCSKHLVTSLHASRLEEIGRCYTELRNYKDIIKKCNIALSNAKYLLADKSLDYGKEYEIINEVLTDIEKIK